MDRRRTYMDIMERVLGGDIPSYRPRQRSRFAHEITVAGAAAGTTAGSVEVRMLESLGDDDD